jgi:hypothetical protein
VVELDRLLGHPQELRHLLVRRAARREPQDLELTLGEAVRFPAVVSDRPKLRDGQLTAIVDAPVAGANDSAQRLDEILSLHALANEAHRSGRERPVDDGLVVGS